MSLPQRRHHPAESGQPDPVARAVSAPAVCPGQSGASSGLSAALSSARRGSSARIGTGREPGRQGCDSHGVRAAAAVKLRLMVSNEVFDRVWSVGTVSRVSPAADWNCRGGGLVTRGGEVLSQAALSASRFRSEVTAVAVDELIVLPRYVAFGVVSGNRVFLSTYLLHANVYDYCKDYCALKCHVISYWVHETQR